MRSTPPARTLRLSRRCAHGWKYRTGADPAAPAAGERRFAREAGLSSSERPRLAEAGQNLSRGNQNRMIGARRQARSGIAHSDKKSAIWHGARLEVQITPGDRAGRRPAGEIRLRGDGIGFR
jgi:hypothetical protein